MYKLFLFFSIIEENIFESSVKSIDTLKFLNKIRSKNPKENSKPAKPSIKKVSDVKVISSFTAPNIVDNTYMVNQVNSEKNNKFIKLLKFIKKPNKLIQKINVQKFIQVCIF